jgi:DTW domain-containing protein
MNRYQLLRQRCLAESTRAFLARGKSVQRCELCQLARYACICQWQPKVQVRAEFILLMHRDEVFKPTNTGRLLADIFPEQTHAFAWNRTAPDAALLALIKDPLRRCMIVFPAEESIDEVAVGAARQVIRTIPDDGRINTFIMLDGTWKQSGRMFNQGRWLDELACVALPEGQTRGYAVRKSHQEHFLSTAEAAALCLTLAQEHSAAEVLMDYFQLFNLHYLATRAACAPEIGVLHQKLAQLTANA